MRVFYTLFVTLSLLFLIPTSSFSQEPTGGIELREVKTKTMVYQIRIDGLKTSEDANRVDEIMGQKWGIVASSTDESMGVCTVEVLHRFDSEMFHDIVDFSGYHIAKTFER